MKKCICSIVTASHYCYAKTLMMSAASSEPDVDRYVLIVDGTADLQDSQDDIWHSLFLNDLDLGASEIEMKFQYDAFELCCALKPFLIKQLFSKGYEAVVYLDADILLMSPLDHLWSVLKDYSIVLTPHVLKPMPEDSGQPDDVYMLLSGVFNGGFYAVANDSNGNEFLDWLARRLKRHSIRNDDSGFFVDQRWLDFVPNFFSGFLACDHPGYNLSYWNLHERDLLYGDGVLKANGERVVFVHFSTFDVHSACFSALTRKADDKLSLLKPVLQDYADKLLDAGVADCLSKPYGFATYSDGQVISSRDRAFYRDDSSARDRYPDPFEVSERDNYRSYVSRLCCQRAWSLRRSKMFSLLSKLGSRK
ncbi:hypothetical protein BVX97_00785 [bacterium E08(2017)]|nr:hypothetical protein BVX97_00785 [bacterium E08(2017)]